MAAHILIVDDDPDVRELLRESLAVMGQDVVEASNGQQALDLMRSTRGLRLVLLDVKMPIMDGTEFLRAKAAMPAYARLPVVIVSATPPDARLLSHAVGFLRKPADLDDIMAYVRRYVA
jgi:CheY-like chemotaxis protein